MTLGIVTPVLVVHQEQDVEACANEEDLQAFVSHFMPCQGHRNRRGEEVYLHDHIVQ